MDIIIKSEKGICKDEWRPIMKIKNCFQCHYHGVKFSMSYICEKTGKGIQAYIWNDEFPPFCQLPNLEDFIEKVKEQKL
jgi:hypothetical protein